MTRFVLSEIASGTLIREGDTMINNDKFDVRPVVAGVAFAALIAFPIFYFDKTVPTVPQEDRKWYNETCIEGVSYISYRSSLSVKFDTNSKVVLCTES